MMSTTDPITQAIRQAAKEAVREVWAELGAPAPTKRLLTVEHAAEYLEVSPDTVRALIASGKIRAVRHGVKLIRLDVHDIDAWIEQSKAGEGVE